MFQQQTQDNFDSRNNFLRVCTRDVIDSNNYLIILWLFLVVVVYICIYQSARKGNKTGFELADGCIAIPSNNQQVKFIFFVCD